MELWTLLLIIAIGAYTFYHFCFRGLNTFKDAGIPHMKPLPLIGNSFPTLFQRLSLTEFVEKIYEFDPDAKYVGLYEFMSPTVVIRDLDLIKSITVKNFDHFVDVRGFPECTTEPFLANILLSLRGEKWRDIRNLLSRAFTPGKLRAMFKMMSECAENFADYWANVPADTGNCVDTNDAFARYSNDVVAACVFGITLDSLRNRDNKFYVYWRESTNHDVFMALKILFMREFPILYNLLHLRLVRKEITQYFTEIVESAIRMRDEKGISRPDIIQVMMESRGKRGENDLTIDEMTSHALNFLFVAYENTSTQICFCAHELAMNPDVQKRLQDEIDEVMQENDGTFTYEAVNSMKYLEAVVNESLRHYPASPLLDRECVKDFELPAAVPGGKPYHLKKGAILEIPNYAIHMDPKYFPEPKKFDPNRFLDKNKDGTNMPYFIPFGLGPRMCIGNRFALLKIKAILVHLLARCDLKPCEKTPNPIKFTKGILTTAPEGGTWLKIQPRSLAH